MGLLNDLNPLNAVINAAGTLIDRLVPDVNAAAKAKEELAAKAQDIIAQADADQRDINKVEAANSSFFVAGARPAAMWLCVCGLAWQFFVSPFLTWLMTMACLLSHHSCAGVPPLPMIGDATLTDLLYALLGLGTLRTADKIKGVDTKTMAPGPIGATFNVAKNIFARK